MLPTGKEFESKLQSLLFNFDWYFPDTGSRIGLLFVPTKEDKDLAEMHFIVNGDDLGAQAVDIPYKESNLYVCVDVYGKLMHLNLSSILNANILIIS